MLLGEAEPTTVEAEPELVQSVKEFQRSSPSAREQWSVYCNQHGGGVKDPSKHQSQYLQAFLEYARTTPPPLPRATNGKGPTSGKGARPAPPSVLTVAVPTAPAFLGGFSGQGADLPSFVKEGQRKSAKWKEAWQLFCASYGGGINDPAKHDSTFIISFLDFLGQQAVAAFGGPVAGPTVRPAPQHLVHRAPSLAPERPMKRPRPSTPVPTMAMPMPLARTHLGPGVGARAPAPAGGKGGARPFASGDPVKDALVHRVKAFQRSGEANKQLWQAYCTENLEDIRDPARHDATALEIFVTLNEVP